MPERLILEPITPEPGSYDTGMMASGKPGLPRRFAWRGTTYVVEAILGSWKDRRVDRGDVYIRQHGFEVRTACGAVMKLTGLRSMRGRGPRWVLRSIRD